ncbi:LEPR-XLL domain-containing protein [Parafrigoribacterium soli]|uniref:LEPR-XLL domain-containing protein n=1 Tax=Parafrigoribacterium soli TaxID=3144663 RepID=UPI0032ED5D71
MSESLCRLRLPREQHLPIFAAHETRRTAKRRPFEQVEPRLLLAADRGAAERCAALINPAEVGAGTTGCLERSPAAALDDADARFEVGERRRRG